MEDAFSYPLGESIRYVRNRVAIACDGCKSRKVKCDGRTPCGYCAARRRPETCQYSPRRRRKLNREKTQSPSMSASSLPTPIHVSTATSNSASRGGEGGSGPDASAVEDETEVPREARLLCDAHGELTFIGDCAPLSFFQSVRRLVMSRVKQSAFAPHTSGVSMLENAPTTRAPWRFRMASQGSPAVKLMDQDVNAAVSTYLGTTKSLVDLFDGDEQLSEDLLRWARFQTQPHNATSTIYFLVLAIGLQTENDELAQEYFEFARDQAYMSLSDVLGVETVQEFILITIYMLCSCQINGAFLCFGIAVRAAYSIGLHRAEVNARFGLGNSRRRDRLWKSLRIVDLFLSSSMGRPPATSDKDCTVGYDTTDGDGNEVFDLLDASVQILRVIESVVLEIYSRRKISLQLTEGISLQLRDWSGRWLRQLKAVITGRDHLEAQVKGACQVLSSYYYAVMLVSRPFLMYELCRRLAEESHPSVSGCRSTLTSGRSKLADACVDAASLMVEPLLELMERDMLKGRAPLLVQVYKQSPSWLFASSMVLGLGLLGGFGRVLERYTKMSIRAMNHFAEHDAHARQYSLIAQSLLTTALEYLEGLELRERWRRTETSSQLFGLVVGENEVEPPCASPLQNTRGEKVDERAQRDQSLGRRDGDEQQYDHPYHQEDVRASLPQCVDEMGSAFLNLHEPATQASDDAYWNDIGSNEWGGLTSALNLFPLLEAGGGIDLAHWFGGGEIV